MAPRRLTGAPLGLARGRVAIREYDPRWPVAFEDEAALLREELGDVQVEHIGSTAVPGLAAKPIIDVTVAFAGRDELQRGRARLRELGHDDRGEFADQGGIVLAKGPEHLRTHLIHLMVNGDLQLDRCLRFRGALRADPGLRDAYAALKRGLASTHPFDREAYQAGKLALIDAVVAGTEPARSPSPFA